MTDYRKRLEAVEIVTALCNGTFIDDPQRPRCSPEEQAALRQLLSEGERMREALTKIRQMKAEPIGDTGFSTGPAAHFAACQNIARQALGDPEQ